MHTSESRRDSISASLRREPISPAPRSSASGPSAWRPARRSSRKPRWLSSSSKEGESGASARRSRSPQGLARKASPFTSSLPRRGGDPLQPRARSKGPRPPSRTRTAPGPRRRRVLPRTSSLVTEKSRRALVGNAMPGSRMTPTGALGSRGSVVASTRRSRHG